MDYSNESSAWHSDWSIALCTGIPELDGGHQHFFQLINELNFAVAQDAPLETIKKLTRSIVEDTVLHFFYEDATLRKWKYPLAEEHAKKHAQLLHLLSDIISGFTQHKEKPEHIAASLQVKQLIVEHILTEDMKCRDYHQSNIFDDESI